MTRASGSKKRVMGNLKKDIAQIEPIENEISRLSELIMDRAKKREQERQQYFRDISVAIRLRKGLRSLRTYIDSSKVSGMVEQYRRYLESDGEEKAVKIAILWGAESLGEYDKSKVDKAVTKALSCNPWLKTAVLRFHWDHPSLAVALLVAAALGVAVLVMFVVVKLGVTTLGELWLSLAIISTILWLYIEYLLKEPK